MQTDGSPLLFVFVLQPTVLSQTCFNCLHCFSKLGAHDTVVVLKGVSIQLLLEKVKLNIAIIQHYFSTCIVTQTYMICIVWTWEEMCKMITMLKEKYVKCNISIKTISYVTLHITCPCTASLLHLQNAVLQYVDDSLKKNIDYFNV